jgi:hypothetical protein
MSEGNLQHVMLRIKSATIKSPIAVFRTDTAGMVNAVFASTAKTHQMIAAKDATLIGVYDKEMDLGVIERKLAQYVKK